MNLLAHFYRNKCLSKCNKQSFYYEIDSMLGELFGFDMADDSQLYMFKLHGDAKCITCLQTIDIVNMKFIESPMLICDKCCNRCIGIPAFFEFNVTENIHLLISRLIIYDDSESKYIQHNKGSTIFCINSQKLRNNSHKLIHRFYHTIPIILLMSISDYKSHCYGLNLDIICYILTFIY